MIHQYLLKKLTEADQKKVFNKKGHKLCYIHSNNGYWRPNAKGYTDDRAQAWVLTLSDAWEQTKHCGPEKHVRYPYVTDETIVATPLACDEQAINLLDVTVKTAEYCD